MVTDIVADFLTRIRNAIQRDSKTVLVPATKMTKAILDILKEEDYIVNFEVEQNFANVELKYSENKPAIMHLEKISKPGLRVYVDYKKIPKVLNGLGMCILSTSKGIMSGKKAKLEKVGGELLCKIW